MALTVPLIPKVEAVDGVTSPMGGAAEEEEPEEEQVAPTAIAAAPALPQSTSMPKVKNDEIKMWGVSELDKKKKKKKGTLGIGNSSLFFASESDKAPVQKISIHSSTQRKAYRHKSIGEKQSKKPLYHG